MNPDETRTDETARPATGKYGYGVDPATVERELQRKRKIRSLCVLIFGMTAMVLAAGCFTYIHSDKQSTCLECRAVLVEESTWGYPHEHIETGEASAELLARYPGHQHHWRTNGSTYYRSWLLEMYSDGRQHPIWKLPASTQAKYATLVSPEELRESLQIIDGKDVKQAEAMVQKIWERVFRGE